MMILKRLAFESAGFLLGFTLASCLVYIFVFLATLERGPVC